VSNDPVLIACTVKDRTADRAAVWRRIGAAFPHDKGAGLTVILNALPLDGRIVLVEPKVDTLAIAALPPAPGATPFVEEES
jgi:hypothetical protein